MSEAFSILFSTLTGKEGRLSRSLGSVTVPVPSTRIATIATIADVDLLLSKQKYIFTGLQLQHKIDK